MFEQCRRCRRPDYLALWAFSDLTVTTVWPEPKYFITAHKPANDIYIANVVYQIELENLDFTPSDECQELRFFSAQEMGELQLPPNVQALISRMEL